MESDGKEKSKNRKSCKTCSQDFADSALICCPHDGTLLTPIVTDQLIGTVLAERYKILSLAGTGGMGSVYKGMHLLMDRVVAIKMLHAHLVSNSHALQRFQQEAKASCALAHPNIISVYDFGVAPQGQPYLVMEYLEGTSLSDVIQKEKHLPSDRVLHIFTQCCDALLHAHQNGVVHRDLKPSNIVLITQDTDKDFVKIVDFGIAKLLPSAGRETMHLTQTGELFGSPLYMSPEQCMAQKVDSRADIYSLGCVVYEALTGVPPLVGKHSVDTIQKHINEMPRALKYANPDIAVPDGLEPVVFKALAKDPNHRYQSMSDFKEEYERIARRNSLSGSTPNSNAPASLKAKPAEVVKQGISGRISGIFTYPIGASDVAQRVNSKVIAAAIFLLTLIVAAGWTCSKGLWYPSFIDPRNLWIWYAQEQENAVSAGNWDEAERWARLAVKAADQLEEPKLRVSRSLNGLGEILVHRKRYAEAEIVFQKAISIRVHAHSTDNPDALAIMSNLAHLYSVEGNLPFAEMEFEKLIKKREEPVW